MLKIHHFIKNLQFRISRKDAVMDFQVCTYDEDDKNDHGPVGISPADAEQTTQQETTIMANVTAIKNINALYQQIEGLEIRGTKLAIEAGKCLMTLKAKVQKEGLGWLEYFETAGFCFKIRTAQFYMTLAKFAKGHPEVEEKGLTEALIEAGVKLCKGKKKDEPSLKDNLGVSAVDVNKAMATNPESPKAICNLDGDCLMIQPATSSIASLVASLTANKDVIAFLDGNYKIEIIIQRKAIAIPQQILEKPVAEAPLQLQLVA